MSSGRPGTSHQKLTQYVCRYDTYTLGTAGGMVIKTLFYSPSDIIQELCELMIRVIKESSGIKFLWWE